jgi:AcrR family transcriptional regulator
MSTQGFSNERCAERSQTDRGHGQARAHSIRGKKLFAESGLDGTSVREIARLAGYTTGAIYFHYANKEELYADILRESLDRLFIEVNGSLPANGEPVAKLSAAFRALVRFYDENPRDLDLSRYLFNGARPRGLTPALNKELNSKLRLVLDIFRTELSRAGIENSPSTSRWAACSTR